MTLKKASVLAFERKLSPSAALMYAGDWHDRDQNSNWLPVRITEKAVRGTISNRVKENDPAKLDAKIQNPNIQRVDVAALPFGCDTLRVNFTLKVLGNVKYPSACNVQEYQEALEKIIEEYSENIGFETLAFRYATNIANGRFLWRNRIGVEQIEVRVSHIMNEKVENEWIFDASKYSLRNFAEIQDETHSMAKVIREGLAGTGSSFLSIKAFARIGDGQEVFPSQELILENNKSDKKGKKSKTLYQVDDVAAVHSQKIGNAIRAIDTWYPGAEKMGPIAIEPYGSVTNQGKAYRQPKEKMDFYSIFDNWLIKGKIPPVEQQHFIMAILIRGGVFGEKEKKE
jgi:CRISPR-associated protein Csy3